MNPILYAKIGVAAALIALVFWAGWHFGRLSYRLADTTAVVRQEAHNEAQAVTDAKTINQEAKTFHDTLSLPAPADSPHVQLCHYTPAATVPQAPAARPIVNAAAPSRSPDPVSPQSDVGPPLVKVGVNCDAQVRGLQDYITRVCLTP